MIRIGRGGILAIALVLAACAGSLVAPAAPALAVDPTVTLGGDPGFDSNSIADGTAQQPRWNSYPGSRWEIGAGQGAPIGSDLGIDVGGYVVGPVGYPSILTTGIGPVGGTPVAPDACPASAPCTTWFPWQIQFQGTWSVLGAHISGGDLFASTTSLVRYLQVSSSTSHDVTIGGALSYGMTATWDPSTDALYVQTAADPLMGYVVTFYQGSGSDPLYSRPALLTRAPTVSQTSWSLAETMTSGYLFASVGFWVKPETPADGLQRSAAALVSSLATAAVRTKAVMDSLLRSVPVPQSFGISGVNANGTSPGRDVNPAVQRSKYYRAWTFVVQQPIDRQTDWTQGTWAPLPAYGYPQVSCGKPALQAGFNTVDPILAASCPWDSLFGMQALAYVPAERVDAFASLIGMLSQILSGGGFSGERLPSRMAQTAWILYQQMKADPSQAATAQADLATVYPLLKNFLDYMEQHPSWDLNNANPSSDEHDIEYVSSWLFDVGFLQRIAAELGHSADVTAYQQRSATEMQNLRAWFFSNPDPTTIYTFYYSGSGAHFSSFRPWNVPASTLTTLAVPNLPQDLRDRLIHYWVHGHEDAVPASGVPSYDGFDPSIGGAGLGYVKYPDVSMIALGVIGWVGGPTPYQFVNAEARDAAYPSTYSEYLAPGDGLVVNNGQASTLFSAAQTIDLTLLQHGYALGAGGPYTVLSSPHDPGLYSGFEATDPPVAAHLGATAPLGGVSGVSAVTTAVSTSTPRSGARDLVFSGSTSAAAHDYASTEVFDLSAHPITVTAGTTLQYLILPQSSGVNAASSTHVAVDLVFDDGTVLRNLGATDQHGHGLSGLGQGGHLTVDAWNHVLSVVGGVAAGKRITHVVVDYDEQSAPAGGFRALIDDVSIANGYTG